MCGTIDGHQESGTRQPNAAVPVSSPASSAFPPNSAEHLARQELDAPVTPPGVSQPTGAMDTATLVLGSGHWPVKRERMGRSRNHLGRRPGLVRHFRAGRHRRPSAARSLHGWDGTNPRHYGAWIDYLVARSSRVVPRIPKPKRESNSDVVQATHLAYRRALDELAAPGHVRTTRHAVAAVVLAWRQHRAQLRSAWALPRMCRPSADCLWLTLPTGNTYKVCAAGRDSTRRCRTTTGRHLDSYRSRRTGSDRGLRKELYARLCRVTPLAPEPRHVPQ